MTVTRDEFCRFKAMFLGALSNSGKGEYYDTDRGIAESLLEHAEESLFREEIAREARHALYLSLKAEFDNQEQA